MAEVFENDASIQLDSSKTNNQFATSKVQRTFVFYDFEANISLCCVLFEHRFLHTISRITLLYIFFLNKGSFVFWFKL